MRTSRSRGWLSLVVAVSLCAPAVALAQDAESLKRELEAMRQQFDAMKQQYERRMEELGQRLQTLEAQKAAPPGPPAAPPLPPGTVPSGAPSAGGASLMELLQPRQPFALAQPGRVLLFDIGLAGDFVANFTSNEAERNQTGTFGGRENRLLLRHVDFGFFGRVDPYASAVVLFAAAEEAPEDGEREAEIGVTLEEANVSLLTLPLGTVLRLGMMRPRFGTLNLVHEEDLPQVDRPDVLRRFFGDEQLVAEKGVEPFWVLPTPFYQELAVGVFNGDNEAAFGRGSIRDPLVTGRLRNFFELGERGGGLQIDLSGATGVIEEDRRNTLGGLGVKYKWSPLVGYPFPVLTLGGEAIYGNRTERRSEEEVRFESWGYYLYGQYDWTRRWAAGIRYDWSEFPTRARAETSAISPYLQFKASEFLRFRVQYKHTDGYRNVLPDADEVFLQGTFILGAHPTERF